MSSAQHLAITARIANNTLVAAETEALTGGTPDADGVAECARVDRVDRAAFVQLGIRRILGAATVDDVRDYVARNAADIDSDRFRIDVYDPSRRLATDKIDAAIAVAEVLAGYPDLRDPAQRFLLIVRRDEIIFGEVVTESNRGFRAHDDKPWTTSSSLDARFARALVNLVPDATSLLDPCCGAGSIVLEAASLGLDAYGVDWKPAMVGMTRENLTALGLSGTVVQADSRTHEQHADAVVTDLPYGHAIKGDESIIRSILEQCRTLAPAGVIVAPNDISDWLVSAGFDVVARHTVMKRKGFTRWVHQVAAV